MIRKKEVDHEYVFLFCSTWIDSPSVSILYIQLNAWRSERSTDERWDISNTAIRLITKPPVMII